MAAASFATTDEIKRLRAAREEQSDAALEANTELAQSIFDLDRNKNPLLKAIAAQIADTKKEIAAAKRAGDSTVELRTELNRFLLERKNLLQGMGGESPDVFVDRLFREAADQFPDASDPTSPVRRGLVAAVGARPVRLDPAWQRASGESGAA